MYKYMNTSSKILNGSCNFSSFNKSAITPCSSYYFYDNDYYLGREFDLLCDENLWILSLVGTMNTVGMFIGLLVTGFISDRYGRKCVLIFGMSGCGVIGLIKTLSPSIVWYLVFELTEAIFSAGTCGCVFIIAIESVLPNKRALMGCILNISYALGEVLLALIAWSCQYWRSLIYYTYGPCVMIVLLYWILPESLRWTLSKGRIEESKQALRNIATVNKQKLSENTLKRLENVAEYSDNCNSHKFIEILKSKSLFWRFVNCCFGWMTCAFLFYGITLSSVSIYGNKYLDFMLISLIEFPAYLSNYYIIDKLGRRASICGSYFITFVSSICFIFSTNSSYSTLGLSSSKLQSKVCEHLPILPDVFNLFTSRSKIIIV
ncbi:hypothetical protein WA026_023197 [Henosepilachna vigintioctopunctata]|uniref:Major facilitator superfamily (MFS) profile domain-containing protein n=1 Tax=Henosepilachna vigintioctopunctata TaxID=420089 RepID=A0AAW1UH11_9CUCU